MTILLDQKKIWDAYCSAEIIAIEPILSKHHFSLDAHQPHIVGERYLMQAVTTASGKKLILLGKDANGTKVVIKATRDVRGKRELLHERRCKNILQKIDFAGSIFHIPTEKAFLSEEGFIISIQSFIEQTSSFLERPLEEQFNFSLRAFKAQESAHATTWGHRTHIRSVFEIRNACSYINRFKIFFTNTSISLPNNTDIKTLFDKAYMTLIAHETILDQYSGFLTHTDFVPHNIRIHDDVIYLLDYSSLTFGNKYEGWARFLNFMTLYNPALEDILVAYVKDNRTPEESLSLRMMRIYRLGEILWYYVQTLEKSTGDLYSLNNARILFWSEVLSSILHERSLSEDVRTTYIKTRDSLRSDDEKKRQVGLH